MPLIKPFSRPYDYDSIAGGTLITEGPGALSRLEPATGFNVRSILVNGNYLRVSSCTLDPTQDIEQIYLIQGGPRAAIGNIGAKWLDGEITCPIRVDRYGILEPAIKALLDNADVPLQAMRIDTNHALYHPDITAEDGGSDENLWISFDSCVVSSMKINGDSSKGFSLNLAITGMVDLRENSTGIRPPNDYQEGMQLAWSQCDLSRDESDMRLVSNSEITFTNKVEKKSFITPYDQNDLSTCVRDDQISLYGIESTQQSGFFEEILRLGAERETYIHGGYMVGENLRLSYGPFTITIYCPLFKPAEQSLGPKTLLRKTEFFSQSSPALSSTQNRMVTYNS